MERLLDAPTFHDQKRVLSESAYGGALERAETPEDVDAALDESRAELFGYFLERANLPDEFVAMFKSQIDFANLKAVLRSKALGIPADEMFDELGQLTAADFEDVASLPEPIKNAAVAVFGASGEQSDVADLADIDPIVDVASYAEMVRLAEVSRNRFVRDLASLMVDLGNVKVLLRARLKDLPVTSAERMLVEGGQIPVRQLLDTYRLPLRDFAERVTSRPPLSGMDAEALIDPERFDVLADERLGEYLMAARRVAAGPEPVVAYLMERQSEMTALRTLLIGKLSGLTADAMRSRLRGALT